MTNSQKAAEKIRDEDCRYDGYVPEEIMAAIIDSELAAEREANQKLRDAAIEYRRAALSYMVLPNADNTIAVDRADAALSSALAETKEGM